MKILFIILVQLVCATLPKPTGPEETITQVTHNRFNLTVPSTFLSRVMSRPHPRKDLSIGTNGRKIINIELQINPTAALAIISIGDPPEEVKLHLDTGVELTWVLPEPKTLYNPSTSSSFSHKNCEGLSADFLIRRGSRNSPCRFKIQLADGALFVGTIGQETFTYRTGYRGFGTIEDVYFGVGEETKKGVQVGKGSLGLGFGDVTINFPTEKLFFQLQSHVFCMHARTTQTPGVNILGIPAFQGHNIGIDVPKQKMYVKAIDCDVLFDGYKDELSHPSP